MENCTSSNKLINSDDKHLSNEKISNQSNATDPVSSIDFRESQNFQLIDTNDVECSQEVNVSNDIKNLEAVSADKSVANNQTDEAMEQENGFENKQVNETNQVKPSANSQNNHFETDTLKRKPSAISDHVPSKYLKTISENDNEDTLEDSKVNKDLDASDVSGIQSSQNLNTSSSDESKLNRIIPTKKEDENTVALSKERKSSSFDDDSKNSQELNLLIDTSSTTQGGEVDLKNQEKKSESQNIFEEDTNNLSNKSLELNEQISKVHSDVDKNYIDESSKNEEEVSTEDKEKNLKKKEKSRMSIEVVYDKAGVKVKPREVVEIDNSSEKILLDYSEDESNLNLSNDKSKNLGINEYYLNKDSNCDKNDTKKSDLVVDISSNCNSVEFSNSHTNTEQIFALPRTENPVVLTISDSENSLVEDSLKNLEDLSKLNNKNLKLVPVEREISLNIKLKCLLGIDENTKEVYQKEIINACCDSVHTNNSMYHKVTDSSASGTCLADISASDNKDGSPSSVNSNPRLYQLQPSRLSIFSTVSSSSSASSGVSMAKRLISNKDSEFSQPQRSLNMRKNLIDMTAEEKQNWELYEKLIKEWKNSYIMLTTLINSLNNEVHSVDFASRSTDLTHNDQDLRSSTPELNINKKTVSRGSAKSGKVSKRTNSTPLAKILNKTEEEQTSESTDSTTPIKKLKSTTYFANNDINNDWLHKEVFAKWSDNNYYPGKVNDIVGKKLKVLFYDGKTKSLLPDFVLPIEGNLEQGFSVFAFINDDAYASAVMIVDIKQKADDTVYTVETDENNKIEVKINDIFLTADQAKLFKEQITSKDFSSTSTPQHLNQITLENLVSSKRKARKIITSNSSTSKSRKASANKLNKNLDKAEPSGSGIKNKCHVALKYKSDEKSDTSQSAVEEEPKQLLGIQEEILSTVSEQQTAKGCPLKVKGRSRSRKKNENRELLETLGPIPEIGSKIFEGMKFILTCVPMETLPRYQMASECDLSSDAGTENEEEWTKHPFARDHLREQIINGGGKVFDNFEDIPTEDYPNTKHITNLPNVTEKGLLCLSVGIRSYSHKWIIRSCQKNEVIQPADEELPVGWSLDKKTYIDTFQRVKEKPFEYSVIVIPFLESTRQFAHFWKQICENSGATVLTIKNAEEPFAEATVVLTNEKCPSWIISQANEWNIPIVSTVWIIQCLIEGKLLSPDAKKEFKVCTAN